MMTAGSRELVFAWRDGAVAYVALLRSHRLRGGHRRALLRFGTRSRKHLRIVTRRSEDVAQSSTTCNLVGENRLEHLSLFFLVFDAHCVKPSMETVGVMASVVTLRLLWRGALSPR